jgi:hypothetical protein
MYLSYKIRNYVSMYVQDFLYLRKNLSSFRGKLKQTIRVYENNFCRRVNEFSFAEGIWNLCGSSNEGFVNIWVAFHWCEPH